ncbi:hypothetical protein scyTo_0008535 [Scyliorhinus torazame]|uniref:ABC transporter domain-containing protein n=1 Tax=Scyliorhinus torazame TaxID=75743 RepID=A0A401PAW6_SCYTO|nr:hypothetical protein [Scyliorhinus torazame]
MRPGMNAILGPTGSGKTSLLDVLANRKDQKGLKSGQVLLNGQLVDSNFNLQSAYVVQDDILMGMLTVKENLEFSANLRLPKKLYTFEEKQQKVNKVIDELGLKDCANTKLAPSCSYSTRYECEPYNNPSDFFLDVINEAIPPSNETSNPEVVIISQTALDPGGEKNLLAHHFQQSKYYDYIEKELKSLSVPNVSKSSSKIKSSYATPFWYQLYIVCGRTIKNLCRNPQTSVAQVFLMLLFGILNGLIYYQMPHTMPEAFQNRHEKASGYYRTSAYFLSKILADVIPNRIIPVLSFAAISYFMMGLKQDVVPFFLFCLTLSLTSLSAVSLAFLVSASVNTVAVANALISIPYVFMMVFGGFLVNVNKMLQWLAWLKWISIFRYAFNALIINELKGQIFYLNSTK